MFEAEEDAEDLCVRSSTLDHELRVMHGQLVQSGSDQAVESEASNGFGFQLEIVLEGQTFAPGHVLAQNGVERGVIPGIGRQLGQVTNPGILAGLKQLVHLLQLEAQGFLEVHLDVSPVSGKKNKKKDKK